MLRGYADKEIYQPGIGTKKAATVYADNGFITLAPDFLGYGTSGPEPENEIEARLIKPATVLQLLASISNLSMADPENICGKLLPVLNQFMIRNYSPSPTTLTG